MGYVKHKNCAMCGKKFMVTVYNKKYCSKVCVNMRTREHQRRMYQKRSGMPKDGYLLKCGFCGEKFRSDRSNRVYCSADCKKKQARNRYKEYYAKKKGSDIKKYDKSEEEIEINQMFLKRGTISYRV